MDLTPLFATLLFGVPGGIAHPDSLPQLPPAVVVAQPPSPTSTPEIADWLHLREASKLRNRTARATVYARITTPLPRERIPWVEASALEEERDYAAALQIYQDLSAPIDVFRMRLQLASIGTERLQLRRDLLSFIKASNSGSQVRQAATLFDSLVRTPTVDEQLVIARSLSGVGAWSRARSGYAFVLRRENLGPTDRFRYATALARLGDRKRAAEQYERVPSGHRFGPAARYQRARMMLALGRRGEAIAQLRAIERNFPRDTSAAWALWLRADLATDARADSTARTLWLRLANHFPRWRFAKQARFNAALISFLYKDYAEAIREFGALAPQLTTNAGYYWLGRAYEARGDSGAAAEIWHGILARDSASYYAALAGRRLNIHPILHWVNLTPVQYPSIPAVDSAMRRISLLQSLGMRFESGLEARRLSEEAQSSRDRLFATAAAFAGTEHAARAIALGQTAQRKYGTSMAVMRLIYPLAAKNIIVSSAQRAHVDPILIAALIRQESHFNPRAVSPVGARGLMQLMPAVADAIASRRGIRPWSTEMLFDPAINIRFGVSHLVPSLKKYDEVERVLAAYNAGDSRVARWSKKRGANDPEIFTERIPFDETRGYVKKIVQAREFYRALYVW